MANEEQGTWHRVAATGEVKENEPKQVKLGENLIGLFRVKGEVYAIDDVCSHEFACLSDGYQDGEMIECPLHQALFHIPTGEARSEPADENVRRYAVKVEGDDILVLLD